VPALRTHASSAQRQTAYRQRREAGRIAELRAKGVPPLALIPTTPSTARWKALIEMAEGLLGQALSGIEAIV
jgi:hypothetical protein